MLKNYFTTGWRHLARNRFFASINIIGLFGGIAFTLLIASYVWSELQVNRQLKNANRQYILTTISTDPNVGYELATFGPIAKRLKEAFPQLVANYYRYDGITSVVSKGDKNFREGLQIGDSSLLQMYGFELLHGDARTALQQPFSVVITENKAVKYFGKTDVVGETIAIQSFSGNKHDFAITAIVKEPKENMVTNLTGQDNNGFYIPVNTLSFFGRTGLDDWSNMFVGSYIELKKGAAIQDLEKPIAQLLHQNIIPELQKIITVKPVLLSDYYLQKNNGLVKRMLYTLSFVGLFILAMAIINFINISISSSSRRMREIGIRTVMGSLKKQLVWQFLVESTIMVSIATVMAFLAYPLLKPLFEQIVGKEIPSLTSFPVYFIVVPVLVVLAVGLLAGLYPSFVLSSLKSVDSLKGKLKVTNENMLFKKSLVVFQFSIALIVLIAAIIVTEQVSFFFGRNLGYSKEYIVSAQVPRDWSTAGVQKMLTVRNEFSTMPQVSSIALSYEVPDGKNAGQTAVYKNGSDSTNAIFMQTLQTDENYLNTYEIPLKAGVYFNNNISDSGKIVINEKAAAALGYPDAMAAIGQLVRRPGDPTLFSIKGVVKDFHFGSMQQQIPPIIFYNVRFSPNYRFFSFKMKPGNINAGIEAIQKKWAVLLPGSSFEYKFMDETLKNVYAAELQLKRAAYTATVCAIIIALLGILGLVSLDIFKRVKEIGVRKVLGASANDILLLFAKEFLWLIIISAVIACPLAYIIMKNWLNNYAYRIDISMVAFILSTAGLLIIAYMLIGFQVRKAALANPVESLRSE